MAAARRRLESARGMLTMAQATLSNPGIREFQASTVRRQIAQQQAEIASAALADQARFQLAEAQATRRDLIVTAPFDGTVMTRAAEPGEVVQAGTAIVTLLDLSKVYLRGFIPEGQIGKVKIGQPARIYLDSNPAKALDAYVERIDPQATFTPENTYFRDDRVKQVVGVKLRLKSAIGFAKPGMPADGEVLVEGDTGRRAGLTDETPMVTCAPSAPRACGCPGGTRDPDPRSGKAIRRARSGARHLLRRERGRNLRPDRAGWGRQDLHLSNCRGRDGSHFRQG